MVVVNIQVIIIILVIDELHVLNVIFVQGWPGDNAVNILASNTRGQGPSEGPSGAVSTAANVRTISFIFLSMRGADNQVMVTRIILSF